MNFLESLKYPRQRAKDTKSAESFSQKDICFQICFDREQNAYLNVVNKKGLPINPDYRVFDGQLFNLLKSIDQAREDASFNVYWGEGPDGISLAAYPQTAYLLMECDNIFDSEMKQLTPERGKLWDLQFEINFDGKKYQPLYFLTFGDEMAQTPVMLNESFALCEGKILRLKTMLGRWQSLPVFKSPVSPELLEMYLSVLYSNIESLNTSVDGRPVTEDSTPEKTIPTLVIEKVDDDKTLYLRLTQELPSMKAEFLEDFRLTRVAVKNSDGSLKIRPIDQRNMESMREEMRKKIVRYAPSKQQSKEIFDDEGTFVIPEHTASAFLFGALASLVGEYRLAGTEKLKGYKVRPAVPKLSLKLGSGIDFLEADATLNVADEEFTLASFLQQYRKQGYILLSDGDKAVIDETWIRRLERLFSKGKKGGKATVSYFDLPEVATLLEEGALDDNGAFRRSRKFYEGFNALPTAVLDDGGIKATLRPYQESGIKWLNYLYDNNFGACLADDMGLGKTVQTIALLCRIYKSRGKKKPSLIVMPKSLLFNWASELKKFAPKIKVATYYGSGRNLQEALNANVILTTYGMVRSDVKEMSGIEFDLIVLDESQNIKNISAQITQAVLLLKANHRLSLSGTPVENDLSELYSLFRFLNPAMFGSATDFNEKFGNPIAHNSDKEALCELRKKIYPYILRRTKAEVLEDLPDRIDQKLYVTLEDSHAAFYEQRRRYFSEIVHNGIRENGLAKSKLLVLQALSELRRIASVPECLSDNLIESSKIPVLMESLSEAVANGHKAVVFFNFIAGIELVGEQLDKEGIGYATMTGSTRDRAGVVKEFQENPSCKVLLMTLKTGGVGLNLTAADTVYIFEPWWNRAEEEQAIGRLHRIGQKSKVMTFSIISSGTIEDKICLLQEQKKDIIDAIISSDGNLDKKLSEEDIDFILK